MRLVLLSPEGERADEATWLGRFIERGLTRYHVRKPGWSSEKLRAWLDSLPLAVRMRCVVHSHHNLVDSCVLLGRHWRDTGRDEMPAAAAGFTSCSTHGVERLQETLGRYSSVFFSPVFPSISKPGYGAGSCLGRVPEVLLSRNEFQRRTDVIALGGVTPERVNACAAWGFDGVAALGYVWQSANPLTAFDALWAASEGQVSRVA